jgi:hypothetical protein
VDMPVNSSRENFYNKKKCSLCYFKMASTVDVKLSRIWSERRDVWEG